MIRQVFVNPGQWAAWMAKLGTEFMPAVQRGVVSGALRSVTVMYRRTAEAPPASARGSMGALDTGHYRQAWKAGALPNGAHVFNQRPYAGVIEHGRRAAFVGYQGIKNLQGWAHRKLQLSMDEARDAAFAIARTMSPSPWGGGRRLVGRDVMGGGIVEMTRVVLNEVMFELDRALRRKP